MIGKRFGFAVFLPEERILAVSLCSLCMVIERKNAEGPNDLREDTTMSDCSRLVFSRAKGIAGP